MNEVNLNPLALGTAEVIGKEGLPFWAIVHFFDKTISNHLKLTTIQRICELSARGVPDNHFLVATRSSNLYQEDISDFDSFKDYVVLETKSNSPKNFWETIGNLKRPIVFYDNGIDRIPLYDFTYNEALRITSFSENSPFQVNFDGSLGTMVDLFYAGEREERARDQSLNEHIGQAANNLEQIVRASQIIESPTTPEGVKFYARQQLESLLNAQANLNEKVGLNHVRIDRRG